MTDRDNETIILASGLIHYDADERLLIAGLRRRHLTVPQNAVLLPLAEQEGAWVSHVEIGESMGLPDNADYGDKLIISQVNNRVSKLREIFGWLHLGLQDKQNGLIEGTYLKGWRIVDDWLPPQR